MVGGIADCLLLAGVRDPFWRGVMRRLKAEVWNDLVNKVYDNLMRQNMIFFATYANLR